MNIKNPNVERLATEVARMTGETKTEAIRKSLEDRKRRINIQGASASDRRASVLAFLKKRVWPRIPKGQVGRALTRQEEDAILGYGPDGV